jgi:hypothetical protein
VEIETSKAEMARCHYRYCQTVGRLYVELDTLDARIARIRAGLSPEDDILQAEAEAAEQKARESAEEAGLVEAQHAPPVITPELKQAYRRAAILMHPDRKTSEQDEKRRTELMAQVNVAYKKGDLQTITKLIEEFREDPEAITGEDVGARLIRAFRRIARLRRRLNEAAQELETMKQTEPYQLWKAITDTEQLGGDPLGDLARALMQEISERKIQLEMEWHNVAA